MTQEQLNELAPNGNPTEAFWSLWKADKEELRAAGVKVEITPADSYALRVRNEKWGGLYLVTKFGSFEAEKTKFDGIDSHIAAARRSDLVEFENLDAAEAEALAIGGEVVTIAGGRKTWVVTLGKPRKRRTASQLKWAKIKGGSNRLPSAEAEEMKAYYEEGGKPSRAPLFHYVEEK